MGENAAGVGVPGGVRQEARLSQRFRVHSVPHVVASSASYHHRGKHCAFGLQALAARTSPPL